MAGVEQKARETPNWDNGTEFAFTGKRGNRGARYHYVWREVEKEKILK